VGRVGEFSARSPVALARPRLERASIETRSRLERQTGVFLAFRPIAPPDSVDRGRAIGGAGNEMGVKYGAKCGREKRARNRKT